MMKKASEDYPGYGFEKHVGCGTKIHMDALKELGVTPIHKKISPSCKTFLNLIH